MQLKTCCFARASYTCQSWIGTSTFRAVRLKTRHSAGLSYARQSYMGACAFLIYLKIACGYEAAATCSCPTCRILCNGFWLRYHTPHHGLHAGTVLGNRPVSKGRSNDWKSLKHLRISRKPVHLLLRLRYPHHLALCTSWKVPGQFHFAMKQIDNNRPGH